MEDKPSNKSQKNSKEGKKSAQVKQKINKERLPTPCKDTLSKISSYNTKPNRTIFIDTKNNNAWISSDKTQKLKP